MDHLPQLLSPVRFLTLPAAVVPGIVLLYLFYKRDLNPEPRGVLIKTFLLGLFAIIPLYIVTFPLHGLSIHILEAHPLLVAAYTAFVCAAIPEEGFKFIVLKGYSARQPAFNEPMDGIVYGVAASLGFATLENITYVYFGGFWTALVRAFTAVPAHACFGALMGYYTGQARFNRAGKRSAWFGLAVAILLHGFYDWPLMWTRFYLFQRHPSEVVTVFIIAGNLLWPTVLLIEGFWVYRIVKRLRSEQIEERTNANEIAA